MRCPACRNKIAPHHRFCSNCGARLSQQPAEAKPKKKLVSRPFLRQLGLAGAMLAGVLVICCLLLLVLPRGEKRRPVPRPTNLGAGITARPPRRGAAEIGSNAIYGKVLSLQRGAITLQSIPDGRQYVVYVGRRTRFDPPRYPAIGERIKVLYIDARGQLKATQVEIQS